MEKPKTAQESLEEIALALSEISERLQVEGFPALRRIADALERIAPPKKGGQETDRETQ